MLFINPKTLEDAKAIIENTVTTAPEGKIARAQEAIDNFNNMCDIVTGFLKGCGTGIKFITKCFTDPSFLIDKLQIISPNILLIVLTVLIMLRFLGFENTTKWIALAIVIGAIIAVL